MDKFRSAGSVILSAILYGCQPVILKLVYTYGGNGVSASFYMSLFGCVLLCSIMLVKRIPFHLSRDVAKKVLILATLGSSMTNMLLYYSYTRIPAGLATPLHYIYPIVVTLISIIFFHEKLTWPRIAALALTIAGVVLISNSNSASGDAAGITAALLSGCCWAFYIVYLEKSGLAKENGIYIGFYLALFSTPVCGLIALLTGNLHPLNHPMGWGLIILVAIIGRVLAGPLFQRGIEGTGSVIAGLLSTLEPITSIILSRIVLHESLTVPKIAGICLVLLGVVVVIVSGNQKASKCANI